MRHSIAAQAPIPRCPAAACLHVRRDENGLESFNIRDIFSKMEGIGQIFSKTFRNKNEFKFFFLRNKNEYDKLLSSETGIRWKYSENEFGSFQSSKWFFSE